MRTVPNGAIVPLMEGYRSGDVAKRIGVHPNTIRAWADQFPRFMSAGARGSRRRYSDSDVRYLASIAHWRDRGLELAEISTLLESPDNLLTDLPLEPSPAVEQARMAIQLVPRPEVERALDRIAQLENERGRLLSERDSALADNADLNRRINTLEREIGTLSGKLAVVEVERRPAAWWLRWLALAVLLALAVGVLLAVLATAAARV